MKTEELLLKLSKRFSAPQFAFLSQVRNQTGYANQSDGIRTADAMALSLWPSRGHFLYGFELKVSRSDWLHEYKDPSKAEAIAKFCDYFYLVVPGAAIVDLTEVPPLWGIMIAQGSIVRTIREATKLESVPMTRAFLCGLLRNVTESIARQYTPTIEVEERIKTQVEARLDAHVSHSDYEGKRNKETLEKLTENLKKFEESSGIDLMQLQYRWTDPVKLGDAVKQVMNGEHERIKERLENLLVTSRHIVDTIQREIEKI
jgi:hypothetical protein